MPFNRRQWGTAGENMAADYLTTRGMTVIERNYRCRYGEIDLIACQDQQLIFVEVRLRRQIVFGYPEESIDRRKQNRLRQLAAYYLARKQLTGFEVRFDVIAIILNREGQLLHLHHIPNAF